MNVMDLRECLANWPYDAERNVRLERGGNGREFILIRQPLGLEQYEVDGRPDGRQVHGMPTVFEFHQARLNAVGQFPATAPLELNPEECTELFDEAKVFLHRLKLLFRLKDWTRAGRDANLILRLLDSVRQHARCPADRVRLELWRPPLLRLAAITEALVFLEHRQYRELYQSLRDFPGLQDALAEKAPDPGRIEQVLLENVRATLAVWPELPARWETVLLRQGEYWCISHQGHTAFLKHMRGLQCLACLLRAPGQEFHVSELLASLLEFPAGRAGDAANTRQFADDSLGITTRLNEGLPVLDTEAKAQYHRRVGELREELAKAEQYNDPLRASQVRDELNVIAEHLAAAMGLGDRDRKTSATAERARCAVTKRIKKAIQKIGDTIPALGHHLSINIKTGYFCSYNPDAGHAVDWKF